MRSIFITFERFMYCLRNEQECIIRFKTRGECEGSHFKPDYTHWESLNGFKIFDIDQLILALIIRLGLKNWT